MRKRSAGRLIQARRRNLLAYRQSVNQETGREHEQLERSGIEFRDIGTDRIDVNGRGDLVLDHHRNQDRSCRWAYAEPARQIRSVPHHHMLVAQYAVQFRDQAGRGIETLHRFVVAAVSRKPDALPAAESLAAQNEQRGARSEFDGLLEEGVEDVDLGGSVLDSLHGALHAAGIGGASWRWSRAGQAVLQIFDAFLNVRQNADGVHVGLDALQRRPKLLVDGFANIFNG